MAVEIYTSTTSGDYANMDTVVFDFAKFFSQSSHFEIIDSYSSSYNANKGGVASYTTKRYKGDPIADDDPAQPGYKYWVSDDDTGDDNDWIIVRCKTTIHGSLNLPEWEAKFQFCGNFKYFYDVSDPTGARYPKYNGSPDHREVYCRFAPWGGWDLADVTPDFNPTISGPQPSPWPCTENFVSYIGYVATLQDSRYKLIMDDGQLLIMNYNNERAYQLGTIGLIVGDVEPIIDDGRMDMPRAMFGSSGIAALGRVTGSTAANTWVVTNADISGNSDFYVNDTGVGMAFFDETLLLIQQSFRLLTDWYSWGDIGQTQPNQYAAPDFEMDLFPYLPVPVTRAGYWFSIPMLRLGYGIGFNTIKNKTWLSCSHHPYAVYIKWDGSSDLYT